MGSNAAYVRTEQKAVGILTAKFRLALSRVWAPGGLRKLLCLWLRLAAALIVVFVMPISAEVPTSAASVAQRMAAVTEVVTGILGYARWSDTPATMQLCVVGPTEYADVLLQAGNRASQWHGEVLRVAIDDLDLARNCQALYVGVIDQDEHLRLFSRLREFSVLTVSERNDSCAIGSMFCLNIGEETVTFDVNLDAVARSGVKVHPHVLRLGKTRPTSP